ncbi:MAG: PhnD/SsuA/transferrin family substrate-binding protein [Sandaracinus sp.]
MLRLLLPPSVGVARAKARGELLEASLSNELGDTVVVEVASDYAAVTRGVREAAVELVWAPSAVCAEIEDDARSIWKTVREGRSAYRSALVARVDARLSLERLAGKRAAWVDALSIGGYLLVRGHLRDRGLDPDAVFASQRFLGTHPAALEAVLDGTADVAAVSVPGPDAEHVTQALALHAGRAGATQLSAIATTDPAPNDALVVTKALDAERAAALVGRVFPPVGRGRVAALCLAMEAEGFERAQPGEYRKLRALLAERQGA